VIADAVPGLRLLRNYERGFLRGDLIAGVVLATYMLPYGIGVSSLAGLPPEAGLYACVFSGLVFWLFCSSRHTAITPLTTISLLVAAGLGEIAGGDATRYAALAAATALVVAALAVAAWAGNAGSLVSFISETVMTGFKTGVALYLAAAQLPKLFGFKGGHGEFFERMAYFFRHLPETNPASLAVGLAALALLYLGAKFLKNSPVTLVVVVAAIAASTVFGLAAHGVALLGSIPQGLPVPGLPPIRLSDLNLVLPLAMACFLLSAVETAAIGRMFARKHGYRLDSNQELLGLAASNLAAGLGHGFPVSGGMSHSLVNEGSGARTALSGLVASSVVLFVALFLTGLLYNLPQPVLAAIVLMAVTGLFQPAELMRLWRFSRAEFAVAAATLVGVLASGLLHGVLIGAMISVLVLLRRASRPRTTELGRVPGTDYYADAVRGPDNERLDDVFVFRAESALLYFNAEHVKDRFLELLDARGKGVTLAVFFLGSSPAVDLAGAELLEELHHAMKERGIAFRVAEARGDVRAALRGAGFEKHCGAILTNEPVATVIEAWRTNGGSATPRPEITA
jgi:high affinity sulfate transporter 1